MVARQLRREQLFRGFSSIGAIKPSTEISDIELLKRDLLNNFYTARGERVMRPNYGSIIWELLFDPFDETTREAIIADVESIIDAEPRVQLVQFDIIEYEHGVRLNLGLQYEPFNALEIMEIEFDRRNRIQASDIRVAEDIRN